MQHIMTYVRMPREKLISISQYVLYGTLRKFLTLVEHVILHLQHWSKGKGD